MMKQIIIVGLENLSRRLSTQVSKKWSKMADSDFSGVQIQINVLKR